MNHLLMGELAPIVWLVELIPGRVERDCMLRAFGLGQSGQENERLSWKIGCNRGNRFVINLSMKLDDRIENSLHCIQPFLLLPSSWNVVATTIELLRRKS